MAANIITSINWVDLVSVVILARIFYIALETGLKEEGFKFLGTIAGLYLSQHYYIIFGRSISSRFPAVNEAMPLAFLCFFSYIFLAFLGYAIFIFLRLIFKMFVKAQIAENINRWVGLVLGAVRAFLLVSMILFGMAISTTTYFKDSVFSSFMGSALVRVAPVTYRMLWTVTSKFMLGEKFNEHTVLIPEKS